VIAGRKTQGFIEGEILVNGHPKVQATWARSIGYVEQTGKTLVIGEVYMCLFEMSLRLSLHRLAMPCALYHQATVKIFCCPCRYSLIVINCGGGLVLQRQAAAVQGEHRCTGACQKLAASVQTSTSQSTC
jgi:hypothetical protein